MSELAIVGAGMGGLALALAMQQAGQRSVVFERSPALTEVGAGIQMGPHVMRRLHAWGLQAPLQDLIARPQSLQACDAHRGEVLATLPLDASFAQRYGAPYATIHRADLQTVLYLAVLRGGLTDIRLNTTCSGWEAQDDGVRLTLHTGPGSAASSHVSDVLVGADGLWSQVRPIGWNDGAPLPSGHLAYRAMVPQVLLPQRLRSDGVTIWMGEQLHLVTYPVRRHEWLNVVLLLQPEGPSRQTVPGWDQTLEPHEMARDVQQALRGCCAPVRDLVGMIEHWRMWPLYGRPALSRADQMARGRVALLGDAAHPMLPYLAQGAAMAIEDASELTRCWRNDGSPSERLQAYAQARWQRNARVQIRSNRNAQIFHATGWTRWARDIGLRLLGSRLMDPRWLFSG